MMARFRLMFLAVSLAVVMLFAGLLFAGMAGEDREDLFRSLGILSEVVHLVENEYVEELDSEVLSLALDAGLMESVDPWAAAIPTEMVGAFEDLLQNRPAFGLVVASRLGSAAVRHAIPGSPAADSDLETWDVIEQIDGVYTRGRPLWQVRMELREREIAGESVVLTIVDREIDDRTEIVLQPRPWTPTVLSEETRDGIRVVRMLSLPVGAADAVAAALREGSGPVVLDLRDLVWGRPAEAVAVADLFAAEGVLAAWKGRRAGEEVFQADPLVVAASPVTLVGYDTEYSGEILAAAMQRMGATLIGQATMGRAPHMRLVDTNGVHLWLPVARWMRTDDETIDGPGVEPTESVEAPRDDDDSDPALERALEMVMESSLAAAA
jgi:carboxyl-terminal processing protease